MLKIERFKAENDGELLDFIMSKFPDRSRNKLKSWIKHKNVEVNNKPETNPFFKILSGDKIEVYPGRVFEGRELKGISIVYEDDSLIVIYKPTGLLSVSANKPSATAYSLLSEHIKAQDPKNRIFIVHRLDRETSGLMMFARNENVQRILQDNWKEMVFERKYIAVNSGVLNRPEGTVTSYLVENKAMTVYSTNEPDKGQLAITHYKTLKRRKPYTLMEIVLETGRKNQIRVHMSDLGHPIIGDKKYGSADNPFNRIGLHAWILGFTHPVTGEKMRFESDIPAEFLSLFKD
ncbi:MAG: RluA family pseudouridine synthase [Bacteroidales bacterium]|nr:RluA family pseudouridine synthase [Bacteroidales bacterium]